jgi:hypothetical protein
VPLEVSSATKHHVSVGVPIGGAIGRISGYRGPYTVQMESYERVCEAPCTLYVRPGYFRINAAVDGEDAYGTNIDVPPGGVRVKMRTPTRGRRIGGVLLTTFGGLMFATGLALLAVAPSRVALVDSTNDVGDDALFYLVGAPLMAGSLPLLGGGIYLLVRNRSGIAERQELNSAAVSGQANVQSTSNLASVRF